MARMSAELEDDDVRPAPGLPKEGGKREAAADGETIVTDEDDDDPEPPPKEKEPERKPERAAKPKRGEADPEEDRATASYWQQQAQSLTERLARIEGRMEERKAAPAQREEEEPDVDPNVFLDALAKDGPKAVRPLLDRHVSKALKPLQEQIAQMTAKMESWQQQAAIQSKFPGLDDAESPLFKQAAKFYRAAVERNPRAAEDPYALWDAAEKAQLALKAERTRGDDPDEEAEARRRRRMASDPGPRRFATGSSDDDDDPPLSPEGQEFLSRMSKLVPSLTKDSIKKSRLALAGRGR
jgi:hypothetical protein